MGTEILGGEEPLADQDATTTVQELRNVVHRFVEERRWEIFHAPKNLAMSLAIEAAELMEHFQWLNVDESRHVAADRQRLADISDELADVFCYVLAMANSLGVDLTSALRRKMQKNARKYPISGARGETAPCVPRTGKSQ